MKNKNQQEQEIGLAVSLFKEDKLGRKYAGDSGIATLNNSEEIAKLINQGYRIEETINPDSGVKTYRLARGLRGGANLSETKELLDEALKAGKKVIFFSYRHSAENKLRIDQLFGALEQEKIVVLIDRKNFELSDPIDEYMELISHPAINKVLIVVDDEYFKSRNCMNEMRLAFADQKLAKHRVIIIPENGGLYTVARDGRRKDIADHWQSEKRKQAELNDKTEAELCSQIIANIDEFLNFISYQSSQTLQSLVDNPAELISTIKKSENTSDLASLPFVQDEIFVGRDEEKQSIINNLRSGRIIVIDGQRGVGKSALVRDVLCDKANEGLRRFFDKVILVKFDAGLSVMQALAQVVLDLEPENDQKDLLGSYKRLLKSKKTLLIFDGVEPKIKEEFDKNLITPIQDSQSAAIVTGAHYDQVKGATLISLKELSSDEQKHMLLGYLENYRIEDLHGLEKTDEVLKLCEGNPLAISLAGSYLSDTQMTMENFIENFNGKKISKLSNLKQVGSDHQHSSVANLIENKIKDIDNDSLALLLILSYGRHSAIPYVRLRSIVNNLGLESLDAAIANLIKLKLIKSEGSGYVISSAMVHNHIHLLNRNEESWEELRLKVVPTIIGECLQFIKDNQSNKAQWQNINRALIDIVGIVESTIELGMYNRAMDIMRLLQPTITESRDGKKYNLDEQGDYHSALRLMELRLSIAEKTQNNADIADCDLLIGNLHLKFADGKKAQNYYEKALLRIEGLDDAKIGGRIGLCRKQIGAALYLQGNYDEAIRNFELALEFRCQLFGIKSNEVADVINNIANVHLSKNEYDLAITKFQEAQQIYEKNNLAVGNADVLSNLGHTFRLKAHYDKAIKHCKDALEIYEKESHIDYKVGNAHRNIALAYAQKGDYKLAQESFGKALKIYKETLGDNHLEVANTLDFLGGVCERQNMNTESRGFYQRALEIYQEYQGEPSIDKKIFDIQSKINDVAPAKSTKLQSSSRLRESNRKGEFAEQKDQCVTM